MNAGQPAPRLVGQGLGKVTSYVTPIYKTGKETVITFDLPVLALVVVFSVESYERKVFLFVNY